jgi:hypothetical protein
MHFRPAAGIRSDTNSPVTQLHPLFHAGETQSLPTLTTLPLFEALSIIMDTQSQPTACSQEPDQDIRRVGMLPHILQAFL